jgi:cell division protein FtsI/penicillin-binding protein 2
MLRANLAKIGNALRRATRAVRADKRVASAPPTPQIQAHVSKGGFATPQAGATAAPQPAHTARSRWLLLSKPLFWTCSLLRFSYNRDACSYDEEEHFHYHSRFLLIALTIIAAFLGLAHHLFGIQIKRNAELTQKAESIYTSRQTRNGQRGRIYDVAGNLLAGNIVTKTLYAEPTRFKKSSRPAIISLLSQELNIPPTPLARKLHEAANTDFQYFVDVCFGPATAASINEKRLPGVFIAPAPLPAVPDSYQISVKPRQIPPERRGEVVAFLAQKLNILPVELEAGFDKALNRSREIIVQRHVDISTATRLQQSISEKRYTGLRLSDASYRSYPGEDLMANLIGFMDCNDRGVSGIEEMMDKWLQPRKGEVIFERIAPGRKRPKGKEIVIPAENGADVFLTTFAPIQQIMEEELSLLVQAFEPLRAYAIMADPQTGAIMGIAHYPSFNPNDRSTMTDPLAIQLHALTLGFEPGSIMKGPSIACALNAGACRLDSIYYCERGYWVYGGRSLKDSSGSRYEDISVTEIIRKSSNIGTAKIALDLGEGGLYQGLSAFGFGRKTGLGFYPAEGAPITFSKEASGTLRPLENWDKLSITRFPIGQGVLTTPLQMLEAYNALANSGVMMQLYVVDRIVKGNNVMRHVPRVKSRPIMPETAREITRALTLVTEAGGTGTKAAVEGFAVAGKTGTAQKWIPASEGVKGYYSHNEYVASFIGFVPAEAPAFTLIVVADTPKNRTYGGTVCGPTFSRIAERTLSLLQISPRPPSVTTTQQLRGQGANDATAKTQAQASAEQDLF